MNLVLDASAGIAVALDRPQGTAVSGALGAADIVFAPHLYLTEVANVVWKYIMQGQYGSQDALTITALAESLVDQFCDDSEILPTALTDAVELRHPVYDLLYLSLAKSVGAHLCTLDKRLANLATQTGVVVTGLT